MGRKSKGSHRVTGIIICINNVKVRIPLDSDEKIQSKEKSILLVKHLSKEFKKIKEKSLKENCITEPVSQYISIDNKSKNENATLQNNNFNNFAYTQNNAFATKNDYNIMMVNGNENTDHNVEKVFDDYNSNEKESGLIKNSFQSLINNFADSLPNENQMSYYNYSSSSNNNLQQFEYSDDSEAEKIIAEWDRLWGDGSEANDTTNLIEREINLPNVLAAF